MSVVVRGVVSRVDKRSSLLVGNLRQSRKVGFTGGLLRTFLTPPRTQSIAVRKPPWRSPDLVIMR